MQEYMNVLRKYVDFGGRARRREYWMFTLINFIIVLVLYGVALATGFNPRALSTGIPSTPLGTLFGGLYALYVLAVLLPALGVSVRRLHDTGRSAWWYFIIFVPIVGSVVLLVFFVLDGEPGTNRWGPNPKGTQVQASTF